MSDAISISSAGMQANASRIDADAKAIVKASSPDPGAGRTLEKAMGAQVLDTAAYKADAAVIKTADKTVGKVLNVIT